MTDDELRRAIAEILFPEPWQHETMSDGCGYSTACLRCGDDVETTARTCPVRPPLRDPWPVLAERLRERMMRRLGEEIQFQWQRIQVAVETISGQHYQDDQDSWMAWHATARQRCEVLVRALRKEDKPKDCQHDFVRMQVWGGDTCVPIYHEVCRSCWQDKTAGRVVPARDREYFSEEEL